MKHPQSDHQQLIERNLSGQYQFELKRIFEQAWVIAQHSKMLYFQMILFVVSLSIVSAVIYYKLLGIQTPEQLTFYVLAGVQIIVQCITAPLLAAVMLVGVKLNSRQPVRASNLFDYLPQALPICIAAMLLLMLNMLAMRLFFPVAIYVSIATSFVTMLIADKGMAPLAAISLSVRMINRYFLSFFLFFAAFFALFLLVIFTFGLAIVFVGPLYFNAKGLLYKELFGYDTIESDNHSESNEESTFDA